MSDPLVTEYVKLCSQRTRLFVDEETERRLYDRLDRIWYAEMTVADRLEVERRLAATNAQDRAWHTAHHTDNPWR